MLYGLCFVTSDARFAAEVRNWKEKPLTPEAELIFFLNWPKFRNRLEPKLCPKLSE